MVRVPTVAFATYWWEHSCQKPATMNNYVGMLQICNKTVLADAVFVKQFTVRN